MKSGATTLCQHLTQHPLIAPNAPQEETEFFSGTKPSADLRHYLRLWLARPLGRAIALEVPTGYTIAPMFPNVAERLKVLPGEKHPSIYCTIPRSGTHLAHNVADEHDWVGPDSLPANFTHCLAVSSYASLLDVYRMAFPDVPVLLLAFEDLVADPIEVARTACRPLAIDETVGLFTDAHAKHPLGKFGRACGEAVGSAESRLR